MAYARARAELPAHATVEALHGDFRRFFATLFYTGRLNSRRRCYTLLGCTPRQRRQRGPVYPRRTWASKTGDLAVLTSNSPGPTAVTPTPYARPIRYSKQEPRRRTPVGSPVPCCDMAGPIDSYRIGPRPADRGGIDGSYEIDSYADVTRGAATHRYHLFRVRRYQPELLLLRSRGSVGRQSVACHMGRRRCLPCVVPPQLAADSPRSLPLAV